MNKTVCKKCISKDVCYKFNNIEQGNKRYEEYFDNDVMCLDFKNHSKFIELPCKVGDSLFESAFGQITEFEVIGFEFASFRPEYIYIEIENKVNRFVTGTFAFNIGKTVFLTKEEAERALEGI